MKTYRSALAFGIALSLALLSPGGAAWAQVAEIAGSGSAVAAGASAASASGAANRSFGSALPTATPSLPALPPAFSAPSAFAPAAAPMSGGVVAAPAALTAPAKGASAPSVLAVSAAAPGAVRAAAPVAPPSAPAATALEGVRRELPDFAKLASGESKGAAAEDFLSRVGELFRPAAALDAALSPAGDARRAGRSSPLARREAPAPGFAAASPIDQAPAPRPSRFFAAPVLAAAAIVGLAAAGGISLVQPLLTLPLVMISLILHEIGHAKVAKALGDPTAANLGRASFNPATWLKHVDPILTIAVPIVTALSTGMIFGGAKAVPVNEAYFKHPARDMAKVAFAGPAVNLALAAFGALAYAGAVACGLGPIVLGALTGFVFINAVLALFNLMPIPPLDGGHLLIAVLPSAAAARVKTFYARIGLLGMLPIFAIAMIGGGAIMAAAAVLTHFLIGATFALTGAQLAAAALPAIAALGMASGVLGTPGVPRLGGSGSIPAEVVAEYRRLSAQVRDNERKRKEYMAHLTGGVGVREELLENFYATIAPKHDADAAALRELTGRYPGLEYASSGRARRLLLRLLGRGPQ
ncbi:MAG: site-2 protease family protein [Elusimicrobiota bacterium]